MNTTHARQLMLHLFGQHVGLWAELTYIAPPDVSTNGPRVWSESYRIGTDRIDWDRVGAYNDDGYGVYYALLPKLRPVPNKFVRTHESGAAVCQCLWVDIDEKQGTSKRDAYAALVHHTPAPTIIIDSGGGLHGIWRIVPERITAESRKRIKGIMRNLARAFNGDNVGDFARVFRLPGTINTKPERNGAECRVIGTPNDVLYELDWFKSYYPSEQPKRTYTPPRTNPREEMPAYVRWFLGRVHPAGDRNNALYWTARQMYEDGLSLSDAEQLLTSHAVACGHDAKQVAATIASPFKSR